MIFTLIIFIAILVTLILAHELGHFIAAKKMGIRVDEFGFGFPPRIFSVKKGETIYSINLIPLGGFVKIYGEGGEGREDKRSFSAKSASRRTLILAAGVLMNFLLAAVLFSAAYKIGMPTAIEEPLAGAQTNNLQVKINEVVQDSPAFDAGLQIGDEIVGLKLESQILTVANSKEVVGFISQHQGKEIILNIKRGNETLGVNVLPRENPPEGEGPIGIGLSDVAIVSYSFFQSIIKGIADTFNITILIIVTLAGIIYKAIGGAPVGEVLTGPVGIYNITAQTAQMGLVYVINLAALLSINLGIINILPIPALDGGRILFVIIEKIKGKPVSAKVEGIFHTAGFVLLILLMILVTYKDLTKLIH